jgi:hypothetical protein
VAHHPPAPFDLDCLARHPRGWPCARGPPLCAQEQLFPEPNPNKQEADMAKRHEVFPSKYLKEVDLGGKPLEVDIESAPQEELGTGANKELKTVLHFRGMSKTLPLNVTNWDSVAAIAGDDTVNWPGAHLELYPDVTSLHGKIVPCIRIRPPQQKKLPLKPPSQSLQKKLKAIAGSAAVKTDMEDEIPFRKID